MNKGQLYIISAPSGAGKTSLVKALLDLDDKIRVSVSHTTRAPRDGEIDGVDYFFVSNSDFERLAGAGGFLEYAEVYGNYYGTARQPVEDLLAQGFDVILEIDWQGARQVKRKIPEAIRISIAPPSDRVLRERLEERGLDRPEVIAKRMKQANEELSHLGEAEFIIANGSFAEALFELRSVFVADRQRAGRQEAVKNLSASSPLL